MMGIIYFTDQMNLFDRGIISALSEKIVKAPYVDIITDELKNGYNVTNVGEYDTRLLQKYFILKLKKCPNTIVLGSSRVKLINESMLNENSFSNSGVNGASLEDLIGLYYLYEEKGCLPKEVLIGLDPWILNENNSLTKWKTIESEYYSICNKLFKSDNPNYPYLNHSSLTSFKNLFSYKYFNSSIQYLKINIEKKYMRTNKKENEKLTLLPNGTATYSSKMRNGSQEYVDMKAQKMIESEEGNTLSNFKKLSERHTAVFSKFIEYLQSKKIKVIFYFSPFHPVVYKTIETKQKYQIALEAEKYFKKFATTHQIKTIGAYDPNLSNLTKKDFADGVHLQEKGIEKIFRQYQ